MQRRLAVLTALLLTACPQGLVRFAADAGAECTDGGVRCGAACVNVARDEENCGECGVTCQGTELCVQGACYATDCPNTDCSESQVCRSARCTDLTCVGVACPADQVCSRGSCFPTRCPSIDCTPAICLNDLCVDLACEGVTCLAGRRCVAGQCVVPCTAGQACDPATPCRAGSFTCTADSATCTETGANLADGTPCGANRVCLNGGCSACVAGDPCTTNTNPCKAGIGSCSTGLATCVNASVNAGAGTSCGAARVCDGAGSCLDCAAGTSCASNPNPCKVGGVQCASGSPVCGDSSVNASPGTACGSNLVCNGGGSCVTCRAGEACVGNPLACKVGTSSCSTGALTCVDSTANVAPGTSCGPSQVCNGAGVCNGCVSGTACSTNPNPCKVGVTSCASGVQTCENSATNASPGASCGSGFVCDTNGTCLGCAAGSSCAGNPSACRLGVITCGSGAPICADGPRNVDAGISCGTDQVCTGVGSCVTCAAGTSCAGNPTFCKRGVVGCTTGGPSCGDSQVAVDAGTSCGANFVCDGDGGCASCVAGAACATNPDACRQGAIDCSSGGPLCADTLLPRANGSVCGAGQRCLGGTCLTARSCQDYFGRLGVSASGVLLIDPDGDGGVAPFSVFCEMGVSDGGWTRIYEEFLLPEAAYEAQQTNNALRPDDVLTLTIDAGTFAHLSAAQVNAIPFTEVREVLDPGYFSQHQRGTATFDFAWPGGAFISGDPAGLTYNFPWGNGQAYQAWRLNPEFSIYSPLRGTAIGYVGSFGVRKAGSHACGAYANYPVDLVRRPFKTGDFFAGCYAGQQQWDMPRVIWVR